MTYGEYKKNVYLKLDEYSEASAAKTEDGELAEKFPCAFNEAVRFAFYGKGIKRAWNVSQGRGINLVPDGIYAEHTTEDIVFEASGAYGYYFETDAPFSADIYLNDNFVAAVTRENTGDKYAFFAYKDVIGGGGRLKVVFKGTGFYRIRNVCLYSVPYHSVEMLPNPAGACEHDIPSGLYQIRRVMRISGGREEEVAFSVRSGKLILPDEAGVYEAESTFFPVSVTGDTPDDTETHIPVDTEYIVINKICALLTQEGEFAEFVADTEQGMQMLEETKGRGSVTVRRLGG